jgi:hypothetical protein
MQGLTIGEHDFQQTSDGLATFNGLHGDRHLIAGLERFLAPTAVNHIGRIARLDNPMRGIAALILYVVTQETVRIGPNPPRDRTLHYNLLAGVKRGRAVVSGHRQRSDQQPERRSKNNHDLISHACPLRSIFSCLGHCFVDPSDFDPGQVAARSANTGQNPDLF